MAKVRIKRDMVEQKLAYLNSLTGASPEPWSHDDGGAVANVGTYYLHEGAMGGYKVLQIVTEHGSVRQLPVGLDTGFVSMRRIFYTLCAFISGLEMGLKA